MAPTKGSKHFTGIKASGPRQTLLSKRVNLVRRGKACWVPVRMYAVEEAAERAGL